MSSALVIPFANQRPAAEFLDEPIENLAEGIGSSYAVIGYKGKVWSLRHRGTKYTFTRPDDGSPTNYIDVIILRQAHAKSKSFYAEGWQDGQSEGKRPTCASLDGVLPDNEIAEPQANACAICPRNVWKTTPEGKKTRDCNDYKRLAVLLLPSVTKRLLGQELMEPCFLRVPGASLNDLVLFGETMHGQGWPMHSFITRISFNPDKPHPEMQFRPLQALTPNEAPAVKPLRNDPVALRITGEDQVKTTGNVVPLARAQITQAAKAMGAPPPAETENAGQNGTGLAPVVVTIAPPPVATVAPAPPLAVPVGEVVARHTQVSPPENPTTSPSNGMVDTGFGGPRGGGMTDADIRPVLEQAVSNKPVLNTAADVGETLDADPGLDDKIAALLIKK